MADRTDGMMLVLVTIWGTAFVAIKVVGPELDPFQLTWYRYVPFLVLYGTWLAVAQRATFRTVTGGDWVRFAGLGALAVAGYHFPLNWGLHDGAGANVSGATGAILVATVPLFTLFFAVARGQERLDRLGLVGSLAAFVGVIVVCLMGQGSASLTLAGKSAIILIAPASWAVYTVLTKPLIGRYGGLFVTGVTLGLGTLELLPLGVHYGLRPLANLDGRGWFWLAFLALLSTAAGYAMWSLALKRRAASHVASFIYLQPVVAAAVGWAYLGEALTPWFVAGSLLVLVGVIVVNQARRRQARTAKS
ncbi:MAG: DMT family transporter [Thermoplasmatota archaeon]